jgi:plastocyanin
VTGSNRFFWSPSTVAISPGGTVTWAWNEPVQPHNVVGDNFPVSSPITKSASVSHTFSAPGTYTFYCETHPDTMRGKVVVQ